MTITKLIEIVRGDSSIKIQGVADAKTMSVRFQVCANDKVFFESVDYEEAREEFDKYLPNSTNEEIH